MSRGVDKRAIFQDDHDRLRFMHNLSAFNTTRPITNNWRRASTLGGCTLGECLPGDPLVKIHAICLMLNHYHIFLEELAEKGASLFLQKVNGGYVQYFNRKYERKGTLYETRFKRIEIANEKHFSYLPFYIHCNPLDLFDYGWRKREIADAEKAWQFLENYRWSSHLDYLGKENFPDVIKKDFLLEYFGGTQGYRDSFRQWLSDIQMPSDDIHLE
jgi:putative transposase